MARASQVRTYDPTNSVVFLKTNERFGGLSNMAPGFPLNVGGVRIRTSEALYQVCRFPHLPDVQRNIIDESSPMTAKMRGKPFRKDSRPDWESVRVSVMRWCLRVKLAQNQNTFGALLLATGKLPIVERSSKDSFWGALIEPDGTLVGTNVLGRLLMELREQFREEGAASFEFVEPLELADFLLYGKPIEIVWANSTDAYSSPIKSHSTPPAPLRGQAPVQTSMFDLEHTQFAAAARSGKAKRPRRS